MGTSHTLVVHPQGSISQFSLPKPTIPPFSGFPSCPILMPGHLARRSPPRKGKREKRAPCTHPLHSLSGVTLLDLSFQTSAQGYGVMTSFPTTSPSLIPSEFLPYCPREHSFPFLIEGNSPLCHIFLVTFPRSQVVASLFIPGIPNLNMALMVYRM